jgi:hypothetical protein
MRQPVCPAARLLTSFCTVANGAEDVPELESLPEVDAYFVHDVAACTLGTEVIAAINAEARQTGSPK